MKDSRRIMFVAGTLGLGGAERQLLHMVEALLSRGHSPEVVALEGGVFADRIRTLGVQVHILPPGSGPHRRIPQLRRLAARSRPDILQASHNWVSAYVAVVGRVMRIPAIGAGRGQGHVRAGRRTRPAKLTLGLPHITAMNSLAQIEAATAAGIKPERLFHLRNAVDAGYFKPDLDTAPQSPSLLAVGRLVPGKRFDRYLDVVARLRTALPLQTDLRAVLVGSGSERQILERLALRLEIADIVEFAESEDPLSYYHQADVLLLTSGAGEGMPNVVLEAMATGTPVVAFRSGDTERVVIDGVTGAIVDPPGDTIAMARETQRLLEEKQHRLRTGCKARLHVLEHYSIEALAENLETLHRRASGERL